MKPIGNIFGFDCSTCEHNRHCYGGNMGNQFRYCQKSIEKIQNLDNLEKQNKQQKDNWNKLRELILEEGFEINTREYGYLNVIDKNVILEKMQELEQAVSNVED